MGQFQNARCLRLQRLWNQYGDQQVVLIGRSRTGYITPTITWLLYADHQLDTLGRSLTPFTGIGNPEPLKYLGSDVWSRRVTQEHRCVYLVKADRIEFLQGRYHY